MTTIKFKINTTNWECNNVVHKVQNDLKGIVGIDEFPRKIIYNWSFIETQLIEKGPEETVFGSITLQESHGKIMNFVDEFGTLYPNMRLKINS